MRDMWDGNTAKQIPFIPENPVFDDLKNLDEYSVAVSNKRLIPFAYNYVDASVYSIDLADTYCCSISGKRRTGKTNLLKLLMYAVSQKNGKGVVIEKESNELKLLSSELGFEYIDSDKGVFDYFKSITDEFVARNKYKHTLEEDGLSDLQIYEKMSVKEPMFIFISDITKFIDCVYHPEGNITNMSGYFENIIEKAVYITYISLRVSTRITLRLPQEAICTDFLQAIKREFTSAEMLHHRGYSISRIYTIRRCRSHQRKVTLLRPQRMMIQLHLKLSYLFLGVEKNDIFFGLYQK